jgi:hypothetical protein
VPQIFISYRRDDSLKDTGRIYDRMVQAFGKDNVFKDMKSIHFGSDFRGSIIEAISQSDIVFVIIGSQWLDIKEKNGNRRLDDPSDFVRIEVETALSRGERCAVIPILVDGAAMPTRAELPPNMGELPFKNAKRVRDDPDFDTDVEQLVQDIQRNPRFSTQPLPSPPPKQGGLRDIPPGLAAVIAAVIGGIFLIGSVFLQQQRSEQAQAAQLTETAVNFARISAGSATAIALAPTNTLLPTMTSTAVPTIVSTSTPIPPTATILSTSTAVNTSTTVPATAVTMPTNTPNPPPTLEQAVAAKSPTVATVREFPCEGTITSRTDATIINARNAPDPSASLIDTVRKGSKVKVTEKRTNGDKSVWYRIADLNSTGSNIGWIPIDNVSLSASCPQ